MRSPSDGAAEAGAATETRPASPNAATAPTTTARRSAEVFRCMVATLAVAGVQDVNVLRRRS